MPFFCPFHKAISALILGVVWVWTSLSGAQDIKAPLVGVLSITSKTIKPAARKTLSKVLRLELKSLKKYRIAPRPALKLRTMMLALGCFELNKSCMAKLGQHLEVDLLVNGEVEMKDGKYFITLKIFDVKARQITRSTEALTVREPSLIRSTMKEMVAKLSGQSGPVLLITSNVSGADVMIGGKLMGKTPLLLKSLRPGRENILIRAQGYHDFIRGITLVMDRKVTVKAELKLATPLLRKHPPIVKKPKKNCKIIICNPPAPIYKRWWFWTIIGSAVIGATTAAILSTRGNDKTRLSVEIPVP